MIVKRPEIERALDAKAKGYRLLLLHGPDEAGSRALADRLGKAMGEDAERIDLGGAALKADPARLADEASAISLFGAPRYIRIEPAGDEIIEAVEALLDLPSDPDPVVAIAGTLRKDGKLLKLATNHPAILACINYVPEGAEADRIAVTLCREMGLIPAPDVARRLAASCNGDRAILGQEIEKLALYLGAAPSQPVDLGHEALDALGAASEEGDLGKLVDAVLEGRLDMVDLELRRLAGEGMEGIPLIRAMLRRLALLAELRAEVARGNSPSSVMASMGKAIFWKDKDPVGRQLARWKPAAIETAIQRLVKAELAIKSSGTAGTILLDDELIAIGRAARNMR